MRPSNRLGLLFVVFALSGFSGLIYESIWTHYLKLFLGHAAHAQTLVLAIFMGGMAIGSWLCARYSANWANLLVGYALTEAVVGLLAVVFHGVFTASLAASYDHVIPWLADATVATAYKWTLSALLILPESVLLGMTFPLMSAGVLRLFPDRPGRSIALLYFTNSIGAAAGVLVSGFILVRLLGLPGTIRLAGAINLLLGSAVWLLVRRAAPAAAAPTPAPAALGAGALPAGIPRLLLAVSLVTGLSSFIYEIVWIRMLSLVLGSSTHAFELMLSAFILGLAFGGLWIQRRIDKVAHPGRYLALVQLAMGLLALSTLPLYGKTFEIMQLAVQGLEKTDVGYLWFNLSSNAIALVVMLPTTFCAGMTLPLITFILLRGGVGERSIGAVYATNTVGAILGVFVAVHVGLPVLGLKGSLVFGAALDIGLGVLLLAIFADGRARRPFAIAAVTGLVAVVGTAFVVRLDDFKMASGVFRQGELLQPGAQQLLFHQDGKTATVSLVEDAANGMRSIRTNGKSDAAIGMRPGMPPTSDEYTMIMLAAVPVMVHPEARHAAVIGFGSGLTTHALLSCPWIESVETIEIEPKMVEAAHYFRPAVERAFSDPRGRVFIDDAKTFFSTQGRRYDVIVSEPSNPWVSGVAGLFSREFYQLVRRHLNDDGVFVQWVQLYEIDLPLVASVLKALDPEFADYAMFAPNDTDLLIVASLNRPLPDTLDERLLSTPEFADLSRRLELASAQDFQARKVGTKRALSAWLASLPVPANSDYRPFIDQNAARARFLGSFVSDLLDFSRVPLPTLEMLGGSMAPSDATRVTPSGYSDLSTRAFVATKLLEYHRSGWTDQRSAALAPQLFAKAARLRVLLRECGHENTSLERLDLTFNMSVAMAPYLSPAEMAEFWRSLETEPCWPSISPEEGLWYPLLKAVALRDGGRMVRSSEQLLRSPATRTGSAGRYVVSAGMLGALASGDPAEARRIWNAFAPALFGATQPELLFQVLAAESQLR